MWTWESPLTFLFPLYLEVEITEPHEVVARTGKAPQETLGKADTGGGGGGGVAVLGNATYCD